MIESVNSFAVIIIVVVVVNVIVVMLLGNLAVEFIEVAVNVIKDVIRAHTVLGDIFASGQKRTIK